MTVRKPGINPEPISRPDGFTDFIGDDEPKAPKGTAKKKFADIDRHYTKLTEEDPVYSHHVWRRYASPVWMDIRQTRTLNVQAAREQRDERHICPLQLDVIERAIELWTNPNDTVLSPFAGIGSEGYVSIQKGRRFIGIELKESYYKQAVANLERAEKETPRDALFATA